MNNRALKFSPVSLFLIALALGCIVVLNTANTIQPHIAFCITVFAVIPISVILLSMFAVSYLEPILIAPALYIIPVIFRFMPNLETIDDIDTEAVVISIVFILIVSAIGCYVLYVTRRIRAGQISWNFLRGIAWGIPCGVGALFGLKPKLTSDIAFSGDYTMVWVNYWHSGDYFRYSKHEAKHSISELLVSTR